MIVSTLFVAGFITLFYGLYRLFNAEAFDFSAIIPILVAFGIMGSALFVTVATWFGATL